MQFRVVIPSHVKAGQKIRIRCPDGSEGDVKIPEGLRSGDSFVFEMPNRLLKNPGGMLPHGGSGGGSGGSDRHGGGHGHGHGGSSSSSAAERRSFLDREIVNVQDFLMALCVGLVIGVAIVFGFILGVLFVTDPNTKPLSPHAAGLSSASAAAAAQNMIPNEHQHQHHLVHNHRREL